MELVEHTRGRMMEHEGHDLQEHEPLQSTRSPLSEHASEQDASDTEAADEHELPDEPRPHRSTSRFEREDEREELLAQHAATGDARGEDGDFAGALDAYKKAADLAPESSARLTKIAESYAAMDVTRKAVEYYQRALSTEEAQNGEADLTEAHVGLGDLCRTLALSASAVKSYTRAVRSRPKNAFFRWKLAVALTATGLYEQAEAQFNAACEIQPKDAFYRFQLAELLMMMRRDEEAVEQMQQVVRDAPRDDYYQLRLGAALLKAERAPEAVPHFEAASKLKPRNSSYQALVRYARVRSGEEQSIALDVDMIALDAYDEDFVRRIQNMSQPSK